MPECERLAFREARMNRGECIDCGIKLDPGTAKVFTCCDGCWDIKHRKDVPPTDAVLVADHVMRFWQPVPDSFDVAKAARRILETAGQPIPDGPIQRSLAARSPAPSDATQHVCGKQGFGRDAGDVCPACVQSSRAAPVLEEREAESAFDRELAELEANAPPVEAQLPDDCDLNLVVEPAGYYIEPLASTPGAPPDQHPEVDALLKEFETVAIVASDPGPFNPEYVATARVRLEVLRAKISARLRPLEDPEEKTDG